MANFTESQWTKIFDRLDGRETEYGLPERRDDSVVLASFNTRKLGKVENKSDGTWRLLARFCDGCDLIAFQEVMDNLDGIRHLKNRLGAKYGMVVSDITGGIAGKQGMVERLAFIFRRDRVERSEVASDISIDRSAVLNTLYGKRADFNAAFSAREDDLRDWKKKYDKKITAWKAKLEVWDAAGRQGRKPKKPARNQPAFVLPHFLTFIRTPHCVSFRVASETGGEAYEFLTVNAHLLYGDKNKQAEERRMEFFALINWLVARTKQAKRMYHKDIVMFGDLNLDFDEPVSDRDEIDAGLKKINEKIFKSRKNKPVYFPFLDVHPSRKDIEAAEGKSKALFRTNARMNQTYDQIAVFRNDSRLPGPEDKENAGKTGQFDYGMFRFVDLFAEALNGWKFDELTKNQKAKLISRFENDVSDHMPIWLRLPMP